MNKFNILTTPFRKIFDFFLDRSLSIVTRNMFTDFLILNRINLKYLDMLIAKNYVISENDIVRLNYQNDFIIFLRKAYDIFKIQSLNSSAVIEIMNLRDVILKEKKCNIASIILIGSAARNMLKENSDIDIVLVADGRAIKRITQQLKIYKFELQFYTREAFDRLFKENEEIILWTVKYGLVLFDDNFIFSYYNQFKQNIGMQTIRKKRRLIDLLIRDIKNNLDNSEKRIKFKIERLIFQCARMYLIMQDIIPLSRQEIPSQIGITSPRLANKIEEFTLRSNESKEEIIQYFYEYKKLFEDEIRKL